MNRPAPRAVSLLSVVVATLLAVVAMAACGADTRDISAERADAIDEPTPTGPATTIAPSTESTESTAPASTLPSTSTTTAATTTTSTSLVPVEFATGLDDPLFPELGAPGVDVVSYDVRLDVDVAAGAFAATVEITTGVASNLDQLALDATGFDVDTVTVDGADATFEQTTDELVIDLPTNRSESVVATISYSAAPDGGTSQVGLPVGWFPTEGGSYVLNEPDGARSWLPSNDHPSDQALWRFEITAPDAAVVSANGTLVQQGGGDTAWIWESDDPMPTYLVHLVIGDYDLITGEPVRLASGDELPITNLVPAGTQAEHQVFFDQIAPQLAFFEPLFGPYPLHEYGLAFVDSEPGLAMETQGRSLFAAADFRGGELGYLQHLLLAHELAHQWFGNTVSPATWSDLWMNEAFATYAQWLWLDEANVASLDEQADGVLRARQHGQESTGEPTTFNLFGFERYEGGAAVVHALRRELGDDTFFALLQGWLSENAGTSRSTADFIARAEQEAGRDLGDFFDAWLYATDLPDAYPG